MMAVTVNWIIHCWLISKVGIITPHPPPLGTNDVLSFPHYAHTWLINKSQTHIVFQSINLRLRLHNLSNLFPLIPRLQPFAIRPAVSFLNHSFRCPRCLLMFALTPAPLQLDNLFESRCLPMTSGNERGLRCVHGSLCNFTRFYRRRGMGLVYVKEDTLLLFDVLGLEFPVTFNVIVHDSYWWVFCYICHVTGLVIEVIEGGFDWAVNVVFGETGTALEVLIFALLYLVLLKMI